MPGSHLEAPSPGASSALAEPVYRIDERPPTLWETALYGWQHTLVDISPFVLPLAVAGALGLPPEGEARLISAGLFAMGVATLLQTTVGNRLPIVQGPSATLTGTLAPVAAQLGPGAMWGGAFAGALAEAAAGAARLPGALRRLLPPAVIGAVVLAIAVSLGEVAARMAIGGGRAVDLGLAAAVIAVIAALQMLGNRVLGGIPARASVLVAIVIVGVGGGVTLGRLDTALLSRTPWLALPALFPFGGPGFGWEFPAAALAGALAGYLGSTVESLGDYAATCAVSGEPYTTRHMNRGILFEGAGSALAVLVGGLPVTSYTQNVGIIATTRVASRAVVQVAGVLLLLYGLCPRLGATLVALPRPVLGGVFLVVCGTIAVAGIRMVAGGARTGAEQFAAGTTVIAALAVPAAARGLGGAWLSGLPPLAALGLTNPVVLAAGLGVALHLSLGLAGERG